MGQSSSLPEAPAEHSPREISTSRRFSFKTVAIASSSTDEDSELYGEVTQGRDYTSDLPDECLASIFHFLCAGDRKRSSLVCHRWLRVDGQSRHRLSLNAQAGLLPFLPALFARFDSVTKLALRCDRKSISLDDDALFLISIRCKNLTRLKLRGCREITDLGMATFAQNCKGLKKLSCGSCLFGAKAMNAVFEHCPVLEELSVKRLRGVHDGSEPIGDKIASSSLKSITLKEILNGQCFGPLIVGSKNLKTLKLIRCLGDWDTVLEKLGNGNRGVIEIHLERLQVTDLGLSAISKCSNLEVLHIVKAAECSNFGLICVAENCKLLRKLHIDGWRTNRIGDEGLIAISKECPNIQELVLIGVNPTSLSLTAIASNCQKLERLALCGSGSIGDAEFACIAAKCVALKKLCIKGCPISNVGLEMLAWGCPSLSKIKVKKCRGVSGEAAEWLRERRGSLTVNWEAGEIGSMDASGCAGGAVESDVEFPVDHVAVAIAPASSNSPLALLRTKFGVFSGRSFVPCTFRSEKPKTLSVPFFQPPATRTSRNYSSPCIWSSPENAPMDDLFATAEKKVLVEIVKLSQKRGMKGDKGDWKQFLSSYDKKFGASLSDPGRRSNDVLTAFLKTLNNEDDLKVLAKVVQCHTTRQAVEQLLKNFPENESPEQKLVRATLEHPQYPLDYSFASNDQDWVATKLGKKSKVMTSNAMFAVDCEMVLCEDGSEALVKVCVVDTDLQVKLNEFVNPCKEVTDYRSEITGVSASDLDGITCTLKDIQKLLKKLLSDGTILVGHSLCNDLQALKLEHARVIDTAYIYRYSDGPIHRKPSLNNLCKSVLGYEVRKQGSPHNCLDDACAAMKLVLAKIKGEVGVIAPPAQEDVREVNMAKLLLHRIPITVPSEELHNVIPGNYTIQVKVQYISLHF
ncbi:unnamed protein product [Malus baccata var. baccata]